ncbi:MAG: hypothetical protein HZB81_03400 [Deltaproteobacteria bacterium]|nr:hypothetical protein [Deltaproteobacteria bacterium]
MIEKQCAIEICKLALKAISDLSRILNVSQGLCLEAEYEQIKKGVGLSIGKIQTDILDVIYTIYPELDDLK